MTRPGTVSNTSPGRMMARAWSWAAVMAPTLAAEAIPDQVLRRFRKIGDVPDGGPGGHDDVSGQQEHQDDIHRQELALGHGHLAASVGEVDPPECQSGRSREDSVDAPLPHVVGDEGELGAVGLEVDDDTGKDSPGLVDDGSRQGSGGLGIGDTGARQEDDDGEGGCSAEDDHTFVITNSLRGVRRRWSATERELGRSPARFGALEIQQGTVSEGFKTISDR